ncbi:MAG: class I SAM-dependent methyltransferase [Gemmatimonadaceae bacterium]|nr:class I SAM-dependent methyltransferase [Gemmatimonadaceae bacterium]
MDRDAFALMAQSERDHWWFRGRRFFIERAIRTLALPANARVLDAGCGSGGNLPLLAQFGSVWGFEYDADARAVAATLPGVTIDGGALPSPIPFEGVAFDLIGLFDVLEHLEEPVPSLSALGKRLSPNGALVITVPALPALWGPHDETHHHYRRYTAATLRAHVLEAGLQVEYLTYMNTVLLPIAVLQRLKERLFGYHVDALMPSPFVNQLLFRLWRLERFFIPSGRLPIGLSLLAVVRKR